MDALLMCGGQGTRLDRGEKPLYEVAGEPMVDQVLGALEASRVDETYAVISPKAPETAAHLAGRAPTIETDGEGYVADLGAALERVERPVLTVVADLPLLAGAVVDRVLEVYATDAASADSLTVCVPTALKAALGVSVDATGTHSGPERAPTGLNVVGDHNVCRRRASPSVGAERLHVSYDARLAVNVNRPADADVAEVLAGGP